MSVDTHVAPCFELRQDRQMSTQRGASTAPVDADCCTPVGGAGLTEVEAAALARVFKALADPVRLRLLTIIAGADAGEVCVCDLTVGFDVSGPTISHHLRVLREAGLIEGDRRGTWIYYRAVRGTLEAAFDAVPTKAGAPAR